MYCLKYFFFSSNCSYLQYWWFFVVVVDVVLCLHGVELLATVKCKLCLADLKAKPTLSVVHHLVSGLNVSILSNES